MTSWRRERFISEVIIFNLFEFGRRTTDKIVILSPKPNKQMALFSFRHSVKTFSEKRTTEGRAAEHGQTAAHLRYITRPKAARVVLRKRLPGSTDADTALIAEQEAKTRKGRVCERFIIALPVEASPQQREALVRAFCEAITKGVAGYVAGIHDQRGNDIANPHAHIAAFDVHVKTGGRGRPRSTIGMARKNAIEETAALWAALHNQMMERWGYCPRSRITHLSYAARGIDRIPEIHEGAASRAIAERSHEGASKPEWLHIDQGHSRAEANALIKEINAIKEACNDQNKYDTEHRLGTDYDHDRAERESRSEDDRTRGSRPSRNAGHSAPPFATVEPSGSSDGGDQSTANSDFAANPPFITAVAPPTPPLFDNNHRFRLGGRLRRVFRELVMLRDTLHMRLFRNDRIKVEKSSDSIPNAPSSRRWPTPKIERTQDVNR